MAHLRLFFNITTQTEFEPKLCKQIFSVTSVHYFFLNGICLNHKKTFEICTTNMANMHAYMSTLGPSKYKYEWCQRILLVAASSPSSHNILNQPAALPGAFPEVLLQLWRPPPHCGWFCLKSLIIEELYIIPKEPEKYVQVIIDKYLSNFILLRQWNLMKIEQR